MKCIKHNIEAQLAVDRQKEWNLPHVYFLVCLFVGFEEQQLSKEKGGGM